METVDKETQKSWKTKAKEKSIRIKALEKEKRRLQIQSQSYRSTNKMLRLALAEKTTEKGIEENVSKKKIKELVL